MTSQVNILLLGRRKFARNQERFSCMKITVSREVNHDVNGKDNF